VEHDLKKNANKDSRVIGTYCTTDARATPVKIREGGAENYGILYCIVL